MAGFSLIFGVNSGGSSTILALVQGVKQRRHGALTIDRRIVQGSSALVARLIELSQDKGGINPAYIERLNATFRQRLVSLARRTRALARQPETVELGIESSPN